jgi:hypothetical protein
VTTSLVSLRRGRVGLGLVAAALSLPLLVLTGSEPGLADTSPPAGVPGTVSVDALPTTQVDGVVWAQVVVGNTVYAGGEFTTARPAGAAPGTKTVKRSNLLAYDIRTGNLITSFAPVLNGQVRALAASPDHKRLYVGGDFTKVGSAVRNRMAAFDVATGALTSFHPSFNSTVQAVVAGTSRVYAGGTFTTVNGVARSRLAAFSPTSGALLTWRPVANAAVTAMVLAPGGVSVVAGGRFTTLAGRAAYGMGAVDAATGAARVFRANTLIRDAGTTAAITSLSTNGVYVFGTGYDFGTGGNFEGSFAVRPSDGSIVWIDDCLGDTYSAWPARNVIYMVGHSHNCQSIGGFPETTPRTWHRALAMTTAPTGKVGPNPVNDHGGFVGQPAPSLLTWFPRVAAGTFTGQSQGAWSVAGNGYYVVLGGEFPSVNGQAQEGLVRFPVPQVAPNKVGPQAAPADLAPSTGPVTASSVQILWHRTWDPDNQWLSYTVRRSDVTAPLGVVRAQSSFWRLGTGGFTDTTVKAGQTYTYRVTVSDPFGNAVTSNPLTVTIPS